MHSLLDRSVHLCYDCLLGRFLVAPSSYTKLVKAVYRQSIYFIGTILGMQRCWLQR